MERVLIIIKPDGMDKRLTSVIMDRVYSVNLKISYICKVAPDRNQLEEHYANIKNEPFFYDTIEFMMGEFHESEHLEILVVEGIDAIKKCREFIGATNPDEADIGTIRSLYGCVVENNRFENVVHASSSVEDAEREIKLWT